jgi:hypothetical protein
LLEEGFVLEGLATELVLELLYGADQGVLGLVVEVVLDPHAFLEVGHDPVTQTLKRVLVEPQGVLPQPLVLLGVPIGPTRVTEQMPSTHLIKQLKWGPKVL